MDLVGRAVRKTFEGFGTFAGIVESYDPSAGYFQIQYEDGDSEEVDFEEITAILNGMGESPQAKSPARRSNRDRRPKKRRRTDLDAGGVGEDDPPGGGLLGAGTVSEDPTTLARENSSSGISVDIDLGGKASYLVLEESPQLNCPGLAGNSEDNASFGVESTSCGSKRGFRIPKKRQKLAENLKTTSEKPSRRSSRARRPNAGRLASPDPVICKDILASDDAVVSGGEQPESVSEGPKPALPPSSTDLDINDLPILDLFSVYTCLRSFSRLLFLSPFRLETFVAALRYRYANSLIDSIHFSILQALKSHLEFLSEGSQWATCCLRSLDWGLLDLVTWPVYLVEYMLIRGPLMRAGFVLTRLKLLNGEYYKQAAAVKLEILRCLCDDVIEVEAIRSELNKRMTESEPNADANCSLNVGKKCEDSATTNFGSSLAQEVLEETPDGNIDECCLCRMDGNLICCDGCPAAFHSRCVGVAKDLLPEGDWYCPDCSMEKNDGLGKLSRPFRGADILGVDLHGRIYFGSCSYLLVSDSCDADATYHYYKKNDLYTVIKVLVSSNASYNVIANAICMYWGIPTEVSCFNSHLGHEIPYVHEDARMFSRLPSPSKHDVVTDGIIEKISDENYASPNNCGPQWSEVSDRVKLNLMTSNQLAGITCPVVSSEISDEMTQVTTCVHISLQSVTDSSVDSSSLLKEATSLKSNDLAIEQEKYTGFSGWGCMSLLTEQRKTGASQLQYDPAGYANYYSFGRMTSSIAEELLKAASESNNKETTASVEDIKSVQLKAIFRKSINCCWYTYQKLSINAKNEKCGWCFPCQNPSEADCLFKFAAEKNLEGTEKRKVGLRSERNKKSHLGCAMHRILSIEERVRSLLSGPWEDPYYSKSWREALMKAPDVAALRQLLLVLESNLRRVALSSEWLKPVDSAHTVGSASDILTSSFHALSNHGGSKRQAKKSLSAELSFDSYTATTLDTYWWRGGSLSRQLFHWKILPRLLSSKSARQAGCRKIPGILYPDGSETKRSKWVAWRAAVEMSRSVAQLICQVKDFESNIRWSEISNAQIFPHMAKEPKKSSKPFKKVIVRRKCIEGTHVKYLLDFGKRGSIPAIVSKHGVMLEESSDGRKKYWLHETHVPLNLVKAFEEKKLARMLKRTDSGLIRLKRSKCKESKPKRTKGLSHLLSREPKRQLCGHCNEDVLIRESVNCQYCNGYFHKKHFREPKGAVATIYTCCGCKDKISVKVKTHGHKVSKSKKISKGKQLQKVSKKGKLVLVNSKKKHHGVKSGNRGKSKRKRSKKSEYIVSGHKRRRTIVHHSYWLNGLLWSRKPIDERGKHFRETKVMLPSQHLEDPLMQPVCSLCRERYNSEVLYIGCESCEDWFHGDVFYLTLVNIDNLIGFKCHKCRMKRIPTCPFSVTAAASQVQLRRECSAEADTMGVKHQKNEEKLRDGACEDCSAIVHSEDLMDEEQREDGLTHPTDELIFSCNTRSTDNRIVVQPIDCTEAKFTSSKHENGIQTIVPQKRMGVDLAIPELLVTGTLNDPAEPTDNSFRGAIS